ncbi:DUF4260 family protein [Kitasatospora sp. NPDC059571]|uniref:DUF4260 family protein n=1 Tax=Kitasatospora sp. NPDC059571 TaxID=3346871 RepID=UPI00367A0911
MGEPEKDRGWDGDPRTWSHRHPVGRAVSLAAGLGALAGAVRLGGARSRLLWTCAAAPDVALLIGITAAPDWRRLPPYAIRPYNLLHNPALPAALLAAAAATRSRRPAVAALAWLGHIGWDRAWGYGPRTPEGYVS